MKAFLMGLVIGILVVPLAVLGYFLSGKAPVATSAPPLPFERILAGGALHARIAKEKPANVPLAAGEANFLAGAEVYRNDCAVCHGTPGSEQTAIAKGMFPKPPHLFKGTGVTDDEPGETYWKVANGIRLTGMPGFEQSLSETQMWQVSLLLANADKVTDAVKQALAAAPAQGAPVRALPTK